jgi:hypothetical protein
MHMEYVDKSDRKTNTYSISTRGGNGWSAIFPFSASFNSEQFHLIHFLWFKIITPTFNTGIGQEPNKRRGGVL